MNWYEGFNQRLVNDLSDGQLRYGLDMISLWGRLFGLRATKRLYKFMRRQVLLHKNILLFELG